MSFYKLTGLLVGYSLFELFIIGKLGTVAVAVYDAQETERLIIAGLELVQGVGSNVDHIVQAYIPDFIFQNNLA